MDLTTARNGILLLTVGSTAVKRKSVANLGKTIGTAVLHPHPGRVPAPRERVTATETLTAPEVLRAGPTTARNGIQRLVVTSTAVNRKTDAHLGRPIGPAALRHHPAPRERVTATETPTAPEV